MNEENPNIKFLKDLMGYNNIIKGYIGARKGAGPDAKFEKQEFYKIHINIKDGYADGRTTLADDLNKLLEGYGFDKGIEGSLVSDHLHHDGLYVIMMPTENMDAIREILKPGSPAYREVEKLFARSRHKFRRGNGLLGIRRKIRKLRNRHAKPRVR